MLHQTLLQISGWPDRRASPPSPSRNDRGRPTRRSSPERSFVSKSRGYTQLHKTSDDSELPDLGLQELRINSEQVTLTGKQVVEIGGQSSPEKQSQLSGFCLQIPNGASQSRPQLGRNLPLSHPPPPSHHTPGTGYRPHNTRLYGGFFYFQLRKLEKIVGFLSFQKTVSDTFSKYN